MSGTICLYRSHQHACTDVLLSRSLLPVCVTAQSVITLLSVRTTLFTALPSLPTSLIAAARTALGCARVAPSVVRMACCRCMAASEPITGEELDDEDDRANKRADEVGKDSE